MADEAVRVRMTLGNISCESTAIVMRRFRAQLEGKVGWGATGEVDQFYLLAKNPDKAQENATRVASLLNSRLVRVEEVSEIPEGAPYFPTINERVGRRLDDLAERGFGERPTFETLGAT